MCFLGSIYFAVFLSGCMSTPKNLAEESGMSIQSKAGAEIISESPFDSMSIDTLLNYLMGKFDPTTHLDFQEIEGAHADRSGLYLHTETYDAFKEMTAHALRDQVNLIIRSATRNFQSQKRIWEAKWTGATKLSSGISAADISDEKNRCLEILKYSSMPGSSRHHWGTDIDLNAFNNKYFEIGDGKIIYDWLKMHAATYGFCQPYSKKGLDRGSGYEEEKWHWSYMPLSSKLTLLAKEHLKNEKISGFAGAEQAPRINIVENYVLGINSSCY